MGFYAAGSAQLSRFVASLGGAGAASFGLAGLAPLLGLAGARWVTVAGRPALISREGRIEHGRFPPEFHGAHVEDLSKLSAQLEELRAVEASCDEAAGPSTFPSVEIGLASLLDANPELRDFLERECSHDCDRYRAWVKGGRRGPKPRAHAAEGRFDALNEQLERRKPGQKIGSWLEAAYAAVPKTRRWDDFAPRVELLAEAAGIPVALPEEAERRTIAAADVEECQARADEAIEALLDRARTGRLDGDEPEDVPF